MKLAILETGRPPGNLAGEFGDYPSMFAEMLGPAFEVESFDVQAGELPHSANGHAAYLITGSPAGVYDPLPWIEPLQEFIRSAKGSTMVGICFGHQVMAEALGGHVEKSDKGWGAGLHRYEIVRREPWMDGEMTIAAPASHQDQVMVQPPNADVVMESAFTPYAGLAWNDRPAISFQFHPEFSRAFAAALIESKRERYPDLAASAIQSHAEPDDCARVGRWIGRFLDSGGAASVP